MKFSKIAIVGAAGQLGSDIAKLAKTRGYNVVELDQEDLDIAEYEVTLKKLGDIKPDLIINTAAFHNVDKCEEEPHLAFGVNAVGALNVARVAKQVGAKYVFISTDYVFPGTKPKLEQYKETDQPAPLNVYGSSKYAGEQLVMQAYPQSLVVRLASLFGVKGARGKGGNFVEAIVKKAKEEGKLQVVNDQWMTPTYTVDAGKAILDLLENDVNGIVHATNRGTCTWFEFASRIVQLTKIKADVQAISASQYPGKAVRPQNTGLSTEKLTKLLGSPMRSWEEALAAYLREKGHL
jgi:dTDP-4-dehydrorhamnose reductase